MKKNLLIIDDEESILIAYRQLFKGDTVYIDVAENLEQAEMLLLNNRYDAVISDLELSLQKKQEGMILIKKVNELFPNALKILMTAYGNNQIKEEAMNLGVDYYFEKPVSIKLIKTLLEGSGFTFNIGEKGFKEKSVKVKSANNIVS